MDLSLLGKLLIVAVLILANAFFVATEFALVSSRPTRIDQLAAGGSRAARMVQAAKANPTRFITGTQLGVTVASLLLGWVGENSFASVLLGPIELLFDWLGTITGPGWFDPSTGAFVTAHGVASLLALIIITFLEITFGEQIPKVLALQRSEQIILVTGPVLNALSWLLRPFIALLYAFTNVILAMVGLEQAGQEQAIHSPEELQMLIGRSARAGLMTSPERELVDRAFAFSDLTAGEVMVPRTEVLGIPADGTALDALRVALRHRHSRFPVYQGTIDNVVGVLSTKDLLAIAARRGSRTSTANISLQRLIRPAIIVSQGAAVSEVLARMKVARMPMAVVLDEYSGTAGIVTLKDLVARLLGEVGDEYAQPTHEIRVLSDGTTVVDGLALVEDVNARLNTHFDASEVDTMGGLLFSRLGRRPMVGDEVEIGSGYLARVERLDGLRIARVRLVATHARRHQTPKPVAG